MKKSTPLSAGLLRWNISCLAIALLSWASARGASGIAPAEKLLPDDTLVLVTTPDFSKLRDIYRASPESQLWNDPAMKPFRDKFMSRLNDELIGPLERELGVRVADYTNLLQGQLTFAITQNGWPEAEKQAPGQLLLLDAKSKSSQLRTNLAQLRRKWVDAGKSVKTEKIRDVEFSIFPISKKDVPLTLKKVFSRTSEEEEESSETDTNQSARSELVIGQVESLLIVGTALKPVEKVVVHMTGGSSPALADLAAYEANHQSMFRDAPLYGWVNVKAFLDVFMRKSSKDSENQNPFIPFTMEKLLGATGVSGLKTLAFTIRSPGDGMLVDAFVGVPEAKRQGIFRILQPEAREASPPPFVPADVVKFQRWRVDGQKAWNALERILTDLQWLNRLNGIIDFVNERTREKDPNFDLRKNLVGNLGDDVISYEKAPRGSTPADLESPPSLILIGSPHPAEFAAALKNLLMLFDPATPKEREFLGRKIYSQAAPVLPIPTANPSAPGTLHYAASGSYVAITTEPSMLEEYLRSSDSQQKKLRETPGLAEATAKVGGSSTGLFGYENQAETTRTMFELLRKSAASTNSNAAPGIPAWNPESAFEKWMDFSLLPSFDKIAKYFYFTVYSASANAEGFTFKIFAPSPPSLKK